MTTAEIPSHGRTPPEQQAFIWPTDRFLLPTHCDRLEHPPANVSQWQGLAMHIIGLFVGILVAAAVWYWRFKTVHTAARELGSLASTARGKYRRSRFRARANASTLTAIEDPRAAAAVVLVAAIEAGRPVNDDDERAIEAWLRDVTDDPAPAETVVFARWAARHVHEFGGVVRPLAPILKQSLGPAERDQLIEGASTLVNRRGDVTEAQRGALLLLRDTLAPDDVRQRRL